MHSPQRKRACFPKSEIDDFFLLGARTSNTTLSPQSSASAPCPRSIFPVKISAIPRRLCCSHGYDRQDSSCLFPFRGSQRYVIRLCGKPHFLPSRSSPLSFQEVRILRYGRRVLQPFKLATICVCVVSVGYLAHNPHSVTRMVELRVIIIVFFCFNDIDL